MAQEPQDTQDTQEENPSPEGASPAEDTQEPGQDTQEEHPLAGLKVVVEVLEMGSALVGISKGGVDPHMEAVAISVGDELGSILAVVPEVLERAQERWQRQPRFPSAQPANTAPARTGQQQQTTTTRRQTPDPNVQAPRMF